MHRESVVADTQRIGGPVKHGLINGGEGVDETHTSAKKDKQKPEPGSPRASQVRLLVWEHIVIQSNPFLSDKASTFHRGRRGAHYEDTAAQSVAPLPLLGAGGGGDSPVQLCLMRRVHAFAVDSVSAVCIDLTRWEDTVDNRYEDPLSLTCIDDVATYE